MTHNSTLAEITSEFIKLVYYTLNAIDSVNWKNTNQVFYSPIADWENAVYTFNNRNSTAEVVYPIATVTRNYQLKDSNDISTKPINHLWYLETEGTTASAMKALPIMISYTLKIYTDSFEKSEYITENLVFIRNQIKNWDFTSAVLGSAMSFTVESDGLPSYNSISNKEERSKSKGYVYDIGVDYTVHGIISKKLDDINKIVTTVLDVHYNEEFPE